MRDYLMSLGKGFPTRRLLKTLGLPIPMAQELTRMEGAAG